MNMNLCHVCRQHWWCSGLQRLNRLRLLQVRHFSKSIQPYVITNTTSEAASIAAQHSFEKDRIPEFPNIAPELTSDSGRRCLQDRIPELSLKRGLKQNITPELTSDSGQLHPQDDKNQKFTQKNILSSKCSTSTPSVTSYFYHLTIFATRTIHSLNLTRRSLSHMSGFRVHFRNYTSAPYVDDSKILELRKGNKYLRQHNCMYVLKTEFAKTMRDKIWPGDSLKHDTSQIVEISAGAGVLTRHLLEGGTSNLIAIEKQSKLVSLLNEIEAGPGKCYQVVTGDSFTVLRTLKSLKEANLDLTAIFEQKLGFKNWHREPVVKVVGSIATKMERANLFVLSSLLLQKIGVFKFGPVEFNLLMFQKTLETLMHGPTSNLVKYQAISVLIQIGFDVECLHQESLSSLLFMENTSRYKKENICLVRLTPKMELITENGLSADEACLFIYFVRNMMTKRKQNLLEKLEVWAPGSGYVLIDLGYNKHTRTGDVKPMDYLRMFTRILHMDTFNGHWIGEDIMENSAMAYDIENSVLQDMY